MSIQARRTVLAIGFLAALFGSLSVHVVMLQVLNVPYPANLPSAGLARLPDKILSFFCAMTMFRMFPPSVLARALWQQIGLLFLLLAMIHEDLVRGPLMSVLVSSNWTGWPFVDAIPTYIVFVILAVAIITSRRHLTPPARRLAMAVVVAPVTYLALAPLLTKSFADISVWTSAREGHNFYNPPYDWHVELPAFVTFAEPVAAAFVIAALVSGRLPEGRLRAGAALALLLFGLRGQFFSMFANIHFAKTDVVTAMLSYGQFTAESLCMAVLVAVTWTVISGSRKVRLERNADRSVPT